MSVSAVSLINLLLERLNRELSVLYLLLLVEVLERSHEEWNHLARALLFCFVF